MTASMRGLAKVSRYVMRTRADPGSGIKMKKRNLRVVKWLGTTPAVAVCTLCDRQFTVPLTLLSRVADAQESLRVQFAEHRCKTENNQ